MYNKILISRIPVVVIVLYCCNSYLSGKLLTRLEIDYLHRNQQDSCRKWMLTSNVKYILKSTKNWKRENKGID